MTKIDEVGRDVGLALIENGWPIEVYVRKDENRPYDGVGIELGDWRWGIVVRNPEKPGLTATLIGMFTEALRSQAQRQGQRQR